MDRRNLYYAGVLVLYLYQPTATAHAADPVLFGAFGEDDRVRVALEVGYLCQRRCKIRPRGGAKPGQVAVACAMARALTNSWRVPWRIGLFGPQRAI